ncbi:hypothetical protein HYPSUDRAFT_687486, partial [Hypholoma sublateritium FD-334 SS-4]
YYTPPADRQPRCVHFSRTEHSRVHSFYHQHACTFHTSAFLFLPFFSFLSIFILNLLLLHPYIKPSDMITPISNVMSISLCQWTLIQP